MITPGSERVKAELAHKRVLWYSSKWPMGIARLVAAYSSINPGNSKDI